MNGKRMLFAAALLLGILATAWSLAQSPVEIVILHTNDIHGQVLPRNGAGGMAEIAALIRAIEPDLILDAGDLFTGTYLADRFEGVPLIRAMNAIGYTAGAIGNHEFDYGQEALRMRLREAEFPLLAANIETSVDAIRKSTVVTVKGVRFGLIGVVTEALATTTHPKNLDGVRILDVVTSIRSELETLRGATDFVIVLAHVDDEEERRIAQAFPEIRLIVGGHNHAALGPIRIGETTVAKTGNAGRNLGRVDLSFDGTRLRSLEARLIPVQNVVPDPELAALIAPYAAEVDAQLGEVVGHTSAELASSRVSETPLGNLVADAIRDAGNAQVGIQNIGGIRARIPQGPITWGEVFEVLPFSNTVVTLRMTGAQLKEVLGIRLLAVSGVRVRLDLDRPAGRMLVSATLENGAPIDDGAFYTVATNDFLVAGGDGITTFARAADIRDTQILLRDAFIAYLGKHGPVVPAVEGRIVLD